MEQNGLLGSGGSSLMLVEVGASEGLLAGQFGGRVELQPLRVGFGGTLRVEAMGSHDGLVGGSTITEEVSLPITPR